MKKLLMVILVFVGITSTALAAESNKIMTEDGTYCGEINQDINSSDRTPFKLEGVPFSVLRMEFDLPYDDNPTGLKEGCEGQYNSLFKELQTRKDDIEELVVIGNASVQGVDAGYDNKDLSAARAVYAFNLLKNAGFNDGIIRVFETGDITASHNRQLDHDEFRSTSVYVIWRQPVCSQETLQYVAEAKESLKEYKGSDRETLDDIFENLDVLCSRKGLAASEAEEGLEDFARLVNLVAKIHEENKDVPVTDEFVNQGKVKVAYQNLNTLRDRLGLKRSVWRNREGKFNTARLASDSIAGVVLGTAGGLITSHLVKKNQVKKGFEDIQCTIGGQKVAEWGDEFTVGIR